METVLVHLLKISMYAGTSIWRRYTLRRDLPKLADLMVREGLAKESQKPKTWDDLVQLIGKHLGIGLAAHQSEKRMDSYVQVFGPLLLTSRLDGLVASTERLLSEEDVEQAIAHTAPLAIKAACTFMCAVDKFENMDNE